MREDNVSTHYYCKSHDRRDCPLCRSFMLKTRKNIHPSERRNADVLQELRDHGFVVEIWDRVDPSVPDK